MIMPLRPRGADRARHHVGPHVDVGAGVADHDRLSRRTGRGMYAHEVLARHREHVEGVIVAQVGLHRERKSGEIGELLEIRRVHTGLVERSPVVSDIVIGVLERPGEAFGLKRQDLVARGALGVVKLGDVSTALCLEARRSHLRFPVILFYFF
jgi:hypothetical protein